MLNTSSLCATVHGNYIRITDGYLTNVITVMSHEFQNISIHWPLELSFLCSAFLQHGMLKCHHGVFNFHLFMVPVPYSILNFLHKIMDRYLQYPSLHSPGLYQSRQYHPTGYWFSLRDQWHTRFSSQNKFLAKLFWSCTVFAGVVGATFAHVAIHKCLLLPGRREYIYSGNKFPSNLNHEGKLKIVHRYASGQSPLLPTAYPIYISCYS